MYTLCLFSLYSSVSLSSSSLYSASFPLRRMFLLQIFTKSSNTELQLLLKNLDIELFECSPRNLKDLNIIFQLLTEVLTYLPPAIRPLLAKSPAAFPYPVCLISLRESIPSVCFKTISTCSPPNVLLTEDEEELGDHGGDVAGGVGQQAHQAGLQAVPLLWLCF